MENYIKRETNINSGDKHRVANQVLDAARELCALAMLLSEALENTSKIGIGIGLSDLTYRQIDDMRGQLDEFMIMCGYNDLTFHNNRG